MTDLFEQRLRNAAALAAYARGSALGYRRRSRRTRIRNADDHSDVGARAPLESPVAARSR